MPTTNEPRHQNDFQFLKQNEKLRDQQQFSNFSSHSLDVEKYFLTGWFDWQHLQFKGEVEVTFRGTQAMGVLYLDSQVGTIERVTDANGSDLVFAIEPDSKQLSITLKSELSKGEVSSVRISYTTKDVLHIRRGLTAVGPRSGDPVNSRVVYTVSEPYYASNWMPCHDVPSDRAIFEIHLVMNQDESLIANGRQVEDRLLENGRRVMGYKTDQTLPTYLMAFAMGQLSSIQTSLHGMPVSIWAREGANVDFSGLLSLTKEQIIHFENRLGPFPWEKYSVVILPDFYGAIEHASVTFASEDCCSRAQIRGDVSVLAHELGHQWFGDAVTIREWSDLWIKEGMATLLAADFLSRYSDAKKNGRLNGDSFYPEEGQPMIEAVLKYGTGPYDRAARFLTQIRALAGEDKFWASLRGILHDHAYGSISTDEILAVFRKIIPTEIGTRLSHLVQVGSLPRLKAEKTLSGATDNPDFLVIELEDSDGVLIKPITIKKWQGSNVVSMDLMTNSANRLAMPADLMIAIDDQDIHPEILDFFPPENASTGRDELLRAAIPKNQEQRKIFFEELSSSQDFVMGAWQNWPGTIPEFLATYQGLTSEKAKYAGLRMACLSARALDPASEDSKILRENFAQWILHPPIMGINFAGALSPCQSVISGTAFQAFFDLMSTESASPYLNEEVLLWLSLFPMDPARIDLWKNMALHGPSYRSRLLAVRVLSGWFTYLQSNEPQSPWVSELTLVAQEIKGQTSVPKVLDALEVILPPKKTD